MNITRAHTDSAKQTVQHAPTHPGVLLPIDVLGYDGDQAVQGLDSCMKLLARCRGNLTAAAAAAAAYFRQAGIPQARLSAAEVNMLRRINWLQCEFVLVL